MIEGHSLTTLLQKATDPNSTQPERDSWRSTFEVCRRLEQLKEGQDVNEPKAAPVERDQGNEGGPVCPQCRERINVLLHSRYADRGYPYQCGCGKLLGIERVYQYRVVDAEENDSANETA